MARHRSEAQRRAVDPETPPGELLQLARLLPGGVRRNPALRLLSLEDPARYAEIRRLIVFDRLRVRPAGPPSLAREVLRCLLPPRPLRLLVGAIFVAWLLCLLLASLG
jgi:hypothetical protein